MIYQVISALIAVYFSCIVFAILKQHAKSGEDIFGGGVLEILPDERTRRQLKSLRHATNSELLCEAFLHAFTGQPLPTDADLMKDRNDEIPEDAKVLMRELGVDPESWEY